MKGLAYCLPSAIYLACFVGFEHITSFVSEAGLEDPERWFSGADPEVLRLFSWHAMEEVEHKAVLFDVYQNIYGNYAYRILGLAIILATYLVPGMLIRFLYLLGKDGRFRRGGTYLGVFRVLFGKNRVFKGFVKETFRFFSLRYNPWTHDSRPILAKWYGILEQQDMMESLDRFPMGPKAGEIRERLHPLLFLSTLDAATAPACQMFLKYFPEASREKSIIMELQARIASGKRSHAGNALGWYHSSQPVAAS
jgi:hypothetical protein